MLSLDLCSEVKVKLSLGLTKHHAMETYWGNGGIAPRIINLAFLISDTCVVSPCH